MTSQPIPQGEFNSQPRSGFQIAIGHIGDQLARALKAESRNADYNHYYDSSAGNIGMAGTPRVPVVSLMLVSKYEDAIKGSGDWLGIKLPVKSERLDDESLTLVPDTEHEFFLLEYPQDGETMVIFVNSDNYDSFFGTVTQPLVQDFEQKLFMYDLVPAGKPNL